MKPFKRITVNPTNGRSSLHPWLRIPVATVVGMVAEGMTKGDIFKAYPDLEFEDIREAFR